MNNIHERPRHMAELMRRGQAVLLYLRKHERATPTMVRHLLRGLPREEIDWILDRLAEANLVTRERVDGENGFLFFYAAGSALEERRAEP